VEKAYQQMTRGLEGLSFRLGMRRSALEADKFREVGEDAPLLAELLCDLRVRDAAAFLADYQKAGRGSGDGAKDLKSPLLSGFEVWKEAFVGVVVTTPVPGGEGLGEKEKRALKAVFGCETRVMSRGASSL
jgi:hypothetical protein